MNDVNIKYGTYNFRDQCGPIPFLTIVKTYLRSDNGSKIGSRYNVTLDGTLTPIASGIYGYQILDRMQDELMSGFRTDGQNFLVTCGVGTLISEYPRVNSIRLDKSNNNWVNTTPFSIDLEWDGESYTGNIYVENIQESWNIEFDDSSSVYSWTLPGGTGDNNALLLRLTHTIGAKGINHLTSTGIIRQPWEHAREFVLTRLGYDAGIVASNGVLNINTSTFSGYNHLRTVQSDELGGTYSVTETWLVANFGSGANAGNAIEDFTATVKQSIDDGLVYVDLAGQIQGVETRSYGSVPSGFGISQNKYSAASGYWNNVRPKLLGRAKLAASTIGTQVVNPIELSFNVGLSPTKGTIAYNYSYNTRQCNFINGSLSESITVSDSYPTDVFARIPILGRAAGPILQSLNTVTESTRSVSIEVVMQPPTGCGDWAGALNAKPTTEVNSLLCTIQTQLSGINTQLYKTQDTDSWNPKNGRYSRNVAWSYTTCTGTPSTNFCG